MNTYALVCWLKAGIVPGEDGKMPTLMRPFLWMLSLWEFSDHYEAEVMITECIIC